MDAIMMILFLNTIMWYVIDNLKENLWKNKSYSRYVTIATSALSAFVLSFGYDLDIVYALSITDTVSILG